MSKAKGGNQQSGRENGSMPNGDMAMKGLNQGDMSPHIKDFQRPDKVFSQQDFSKTLNYIERQNEFTGKEASGIDKQAYQGRYS